MYKIKVDAKKIKEEYVEIACETVKFAADVLKLNENEDTSADYEKVAKLDIANYLMYLSASDGYINDEEASFISELCDIDASAEKIAEYIRNNNTYSKEFESIVPISFKVVTALQNALPEDKRNECNLPALMLQLYLFLGTALANVDGKIDIDEERDFAIYMNMLKDYVEAEIGEVDIDIAKNNGFIMSEIEINEEDDEVKEFFTVQCSHLIEKARTTVNEIDSMISDVVDRVNLNDSLNNILKSELALFMMYLSASDGILSDLEVEAINRICDMELTTEAIAACIQNNGIYTTDFERKAPATLQLMVTLGKQLDDEERMLGANTIVGLFELVGEVFSMCDGRADIMEKNDLKVYIDMMKEYVEKNLGNKENNDNTLDNYLKMASKLQSFEYKGVRAPKKQ